MGTISERYDRIRQNMADACARAKRDPEEITLVAVTKFVPPERIAPALALGIRHVGENRAQEFRDKLLFFNEHGCVCHFIGQLQSNKIKYIIGQAALIQSVDRPALAEEIDAQAQRRGVDRQDILIEVNIGEETQKGGVAPGELRELLENLQALERVRVMGLMCVPPALEAERARPYFARMREIFEACSGMGGNVEMRHLSMGMSADYTAAIEEGATMIRVGSALFGQRQY